MAGNRHDERRREPGGGRAVSGADGRDDERLRPEERLRRHADYGRCYRTGRRRHGRLAVLHAAANRQGHARLGITASRRVGNAVVRHRLKRRIREIYRRWKRRGELPALDLVVHLKPAAAAADFGELRREMHRLLTAYLPSSGPSDDPVGSGGS